MSQPSELDLEGRLYLAWLAFFEAIAQVRVATTFKVAADTATIEYFRLCKLAGISHETALATSDTIIERAQHDAGV